MLASEAESARHAKSTRLSLLWKVEAVNSSPLNSSYCGFKLVQVRFLQVFWPAGDRGLRRPLHLRRSSSTTELLHHLVFTYEGIDLFEEKLFFIKKQSLRIYHKLLHLSFLSFSRISHSNAPKQPITHQDALTSTGCTSVASWFER